MCSFQDHVRRNNGRKARNQAKPLAKHEFLLCCLEFVPSLAILPEIIPVTPIWLTRSLSESRKTHSCVNEPRHGCLVSLTIFFLMSDRSLSHSKHKTVHGRSKKTSNLEEFLPKPVCIGPQNAGQRQRSAPCFWIKEGRAIVVLF